MTRAGTTITVPYTITGEHAGDATQVSVLLLDSPYEAGVALTSGFADGDTESSTGLTYSFSRAPGEHAGTYTITPSSASDTSDNYSFKYETGILTINKRAITITANPQTITYGASIPGDPTKVSVTSGSLLSGHSIPGITLTPDSTNVTDNGTVTPSAAVIKNANNEEVTSNYDITYLNGVLTINKADSAYTTDPAAVSDLAYNGSQLSLISSGVTADGTINYKVEAIAVSDTGGTVPSDGFDSADFSSSLPYATKAWTYKVTYYIAGDSNHNNSSESTIKIAIAKGTPDIGTVTADDLANTTDASTVTLTLTLPTREVSA